MVLPRVITALLLVPIVLPAVWVGSIPFFLFVCLICLLGFWEYANMAEAGGYPNQLWVGFAGTLFMLMSLYLDGALPWGPIHKAPSPMFVLVVWVFLSFFREFFNRDKGHALLRIVTTLAGVLLCGFLLGHLILLRDLRLIAGEGFHFIGREIVFFLLAIIWATDVGAWLVGRSMGRIRIAPLISPKKTLEGSVGGILISIVVAWLFRAAFLREAISAGQAVFFAVLLSLVAQFSDLAESLIKRSFGVKNSSELLPGHGGVLDRFDSFLFAAPVFYYLLLVSGRFQ